LEIHHIPQARPAGQVVPGYVYSQGSSIALPRAMHRGLPSTSRMTGTYTGTPRQLLSQQLRDLANAGVPRDSLRELGAHIRANHPGIFQ
jgi:hypothetical protein